MQTIQANVTDTNRKPKGMMNIEIDRRAGDIATVKHAGEIYGFTGKTGTRFADGASVREMATDKDRRIWIAVDGSSIDED